MGYEPGISRALWSNVKGLRWYTVKSMLRRAPERTSEERRNALEEANRVRFARADVKRDLKSGSLSIYDLLMAPSEELKGAKVEEILLAMRGMGRVKVTRIMREAGVSRSKTLVGLTHGQRDRLIEALGCGEEG
jgi:S13-like H2TH domain